MGIMYTPTMDQLLNVIINNGPVWQLKASDTGLGPSPQLVIPETITGRLIDLSTEEILKIKFGKAVTVGFEGVNYSFVQTGKERRFHAPEIVGTRRIIMFGRKKRFDDKRRSEFARAVSEMLATQTALAPRDSLEDAHGRINRKAIGYIYGFVDCALRSVGEDMADISIGIPITHHVIRALFPGREQVYIEFLVKNLSDEMVVLGMMTGGQQYADFIIKPGAQGVPMGLAKFILQGDE